MMSKLTPESLTTPPKKGEAIPLPEEDAIEASHSLRNLLIDAALSLKHDRKCRTAEARLHGGGETTQDFYALKASIKNRSGMSMTQASYVVRGLVVQNKLPRPEEGLFEHCCAVLDIDPLDSSKVNSFGIKDIVRGVSTLLGVECPTFPRKMRKQTLKKLEYPTIARNKRRQKAQERTRLHREEEFNKRRENTQGTSA